MTVDPRKWEQTPEALEKRFEVLFNQIQALSTTITTLSVGAPAVSVPDIDSAPLSYYATAYGDSQTFPWGNWKDVNFNHLAVGSAFLDASGHYTVQAPGLYLCTCSLVPINGVSGDYINASFWVNGGEVSKIGEKVIGVTSSKGEALNGSALLMLSAGDVLIPRFYTEFDYPTHTTKTIAGGQGVCQYAVLKVG